MKKATLFLSILSVAYTSFGQSVNSHKALTNKILQQQNTGAQQKTTGAKERLAATSTYTIGSNPLNGLSLSDSTRLKYSSGRGSSFNIAVLDMEGDISESAMYDSSWSYSVDQGNLELNTLTTATYNNSNKRISLTDIVSNSGTLENDKDTRYEYNTNGDVSIEHSLVWNQATNVWDSMSRKYYTYNSQNKLTEEKIYSVMAAQWSDKTTYHYNSVGYMDTVLVESYNGTSWEPQNREILSYYTNNNLKVTLSQRFDNTMMDWKNDYKDSLGYTGNATVYTFNESKHWSDMLNDWENDMQITRTLNSNNLPSQQTINVWDGSSNTWQSEGTFEFTYNANNNPVKMEMKYVIQSIPLTVTRMNMYYENYFDLGIDNGVSKVSKLSVYPNPATDKITLSFDKQNSNTVILTIVNAAGQVIARSSRKLENNNVDVSLMGLQAGTYYINAQMSNGNIASTTIVKM